MIIDNGPESYTDIYGSWPDSAGGLSPGKHDKLIESLADAMNDTPRQSPESDGDHVSVFPPDSPQASPTDSSPSVSPEWS